MTKLAKRVAMKKTLYLLKSLRPKHYLKNLIIFAAPFFSFHLEPILWAKAVGGFLAFCFISSAIYLLNDIIDLEEDKLHPVKRFRPIAADEALTYESGGFSSWYLPSIDELSEMYNTLGQWGPEGNINGFSSGGVLVFIRSRNTTCL